MPCPKPRRKKGKKKSRFKYQITYLDPADPEGERVKTWRFKTKSGARHHQIGLKSAWGEKDARQFPIRRIKRR